MASKDLPANVATWTNLHVVQWLLQRDQKTFVPAVVAAIMMRPADFAASTLTQLSTSQFIALASGIAVAVAFVVFDRAAEQHPEAAMALGIDGELVDEDEDEEEPEKASKKKRKPTEDERSITPFLISAPSVIGPTKYITAATLCG